MYSVVAHQNYGRERRDNRQQTQQHGQSSQPHHHHHHHHHHQQHHQSYHHHHHGQNVPGSGSDSFGVDRSESGAGGTGDCTSRGQSGQQHHHPDGRRRSQRHRNLSITGRFLNYLKRRFNPVQGKQDKVNIKHFDSNRRKTPTLGENDYYLYNLSRLVTFQIVETNVSE